MQTSLSYRTNRDLFSNHYLTDHLRDTEHWNEVDEDEVREAYDAIYELYEDKRYRVEDYNESQLERNFIRPVFDILGIPFEIEETVERNARRPDYGFFTTEEAADAAFDRSNFYEEAIAVADAKRWGRKLDTRGEEKRDFENPSYQIHTYLQDTPTRWAVLTNGQKWRIYYGPTSHRLDSYYEIDLPTLLQRVTPEANLEDFRDFYLFFRREAFVEGSSGDCFLDEVFDESKVFAEAIGEDLKDNIYEAIRVLAEGFLETNDDLGEDNLGLIHDSSLIYLYRLIFVLYAESEGRNLLPTDNQIYHESYSLNELKRTVAKNRDGTQQNYQSWQTGLWDRLEELFVLVDQGSQGEDIPKEDLYIPAYNGGLFRTSPDSNDRKEAQFLASHEVGDIYIAEVIDLLTRREADEGEGLVFVDYSSLDERHLGSIYEGLLEYKLDIADTPLALDDGEYVVPDNSDEIVVDEGDVYLRTDAGERKATGSYYTPEYVVEYIVDETLGPLIDEIRGNLMSENVDTPHDREGFARDFAERVFDLKILDPAMGSGHFLVNAVDYLAREIIDAQERQDQQAVQKGDKGAISDPRTEEGELRDVNWARRKVAQRCIYGVDLNPLATELTKVSLWLRTLAAEQPLAFLNHHLKTGNSLVGTDIEEIEQLETESHGTDGNSTLSDFGIARKGTIEQLMRIYQDFIAIENQDLTDIKEMEAKYDEFERNKLRRRLEAMANVHTAEEFGLDNLPSDSYKRMAAALENSSNWDSIQQMEWFRNAQNWADKIRYFHWKLEFPEVFYSESGEPARNPGFDAVIGNPPYGASLSDQLISYFESNYSHQDYQLDTYLLFLERGLELTSPDHYFGMIIPNTLLSNLKYEKIRKYIINEMSIKNIIFYRDSVFQEVTVDTMILTIEKSKAASDHIVSIKISEKQDEYTQSIPQDYWKQKEGGPINIFENKKTIKIGNKLKDLPILNDLCEITQGAKPFQVGKGDPPQTREIVDEKPFVSEEKEDSSYRPLLSGSDIERYHIRWDQDNWIKLGDWLAEPRYSANYDAPEKIVIRQTGDSLIAALDTDQYVIRDNLYTIQCQNLDQKVVLGLINSRLLNWFYQNVLNPEKGEALAQVKRGHLSKLPFPEDIPSTIEKFEGIDISEFTDAFVKQGECPSEVDDLSRKKLYKVTANLVEELIDLKNTHHSINLSILDYFGHYSEGKKLAEIGSYEPSFGVADSILTATEDEFNNLRIGDLTVKRNDSKSVEILATARYKPENPDLHETDRWGYTETDYISVFNISDLIEIEAGLIEVFVPLAGERAGGFANFRKAATKTISPLDRIDEIILPKIEDISKGLSRYLDAKTQANDLENKIQNTKQSINEIVYLLYDLDQDEISIVEEFFN